MQIILRTTVVLLMGMGLANAQPSTEPPGGVVDVDECVAEIGALDRDGDGYVTSGEYPQFNRIRMRVDTDQDGQISPDERYVACDQGIWQAFASPE